MEQFIENFLTNLFGYQVLTYVQWVEDEPIVFALYYGILVICLFPLVRLFQRVGKSPWWSLLMFTPLGLYVPLGDFYLIWPPGYVIAAWVLAFSTWPRIKTRVENR